jgi:PncC family amidohydrolase
VVGRLKALGKTLALAESCTAGLVADLIARVPGASKVFWGSFVTYTPDAKIKMLAIPEELIKKYGEVSEAVALAMAEGALEKSGASLAVSVTGLAGPSGDGSNTPVGTVWIGFAVRDERVRETKMFHFNGSRDEVRKAAAAIVLEKVWKHIDNKEDFV